MLWIILIVLIIVGVCTNNFTPLKVFGKIMAWFFGIILAISLIAALIVPLLFGALAESAHENNKKEQEAYWERVKQTPLIQWACDADGYQLYLGERPEYVYQCSTGKLIADLSLGGYTCYPSYKTVNHWKFCEHKANLNNSKYNNLLGN